MQCETVNYQFTPTTCKHFQEKRQKAFSQGFQRKRDFFDVDSERSIFEHWGEGLNSFTPNSIQDILSLYNFRIISGRQLMRKRKVSIKRLSLKPILNSPNENHKQCMTDSMENFKRDLTSKRLKNTFNLPKAVQTKLIFSCSISELWILARQHLKAFHVQWIKHNFL